MPVEYPAGWPSVARIRGANLTAAGPVAAVTYVFGVIGFFMVFRGIRRGLQAIPLLEGGALALGTLESRQRTNMKVNNRVVYRLFYSYTAQDSQKYQAVTSDESATNFDAENEPVLYDPQNPASALVLKGLPCRVSFDEGGNPSAGAVSTVLSLVVPAAAVLGNLLYRLFLPQWF